MSLYRFRDSTYLHYKKYWFVWDSAWDGYRPVDALRWTGTTYELVDTTYTHDPLSQFYGYGSAVMKKVCDMLTEKYPKEQASVVKHLSIGPQEWFRDRLVNVSPCAPRDNGSWKKMTMGHRRTCRRGPANKFTHRKIAK
jgi:hypothetical protein